MLHLTTSKNWLNTVGYVLATNPCIESLQTDTLTLLLSLALLRYAVSSRQNQSITQYSQHSGLAQWQTKGQQIRTYCQWIRSYSLLHCSDITLLWSALHTRSADAITREWTNTSRANTGQLLILNHKKGCHFSSRQGDHDSRNDHVYCTENS